MTFRLGILGYPLGHSMSPVFQQAALDHLGIDARYEAWPVPEALAGQVAKLRQPEVLGANVTVPHKEAVLSLLDWISPWARQAGAVNTIVHRQGRLLGYNTDSHGFLQGLREAGFHGRGASVLLIGAGGAAKGVGLALAYLGVARITIANRTRERAQELAALLSRHGPRTQVIPLEPEALGPAALASQLIVQSTTLGMKGGPGEGASPLAAESIPREALVYDLVYNPLETPLLREAKKAGARTVGGLPMLIHQGAAGFQLWTGREAPVEVMFQAAQRALAATH